MTANVYMTCYCTKCYIMQHGTSIYKQCNSLVERKNMMAIEQKGLFCLGQFSATVSIVLNIRKRTAECWNVSGLSNWENTPTWLPRIYSISKWIYFALHTYFENVTIFWHETQVSWEARCRCLLDITLCLLSLYIHTISSHYCRESINAIYPNLSLHAFLPL